MAIQSLNALVTVMAGKNEIASEAIHRRLEELRAQLLGSRPTPLEGLLVERILVSWLEVCHADAANLPGGLMTLSQGEFQRRRLEAAQRRYLPAIRALAVIRRLQVPLVQVNIADRQVTVAGRI